jgi:hypothetical protein
VAERTIEARRAQTLEACRQSRYMAARRRIEQIATTAPLLTPEQFAELRGLLPAPSDTGR